MFASQVAKTSPKGAASFSSQLAFQRSTTAAQTPGGRGADQTHVRQRNIGDSELPGQLGQQRPWPMRNEPQSQEEHLADPKILTASGAEPSLSRDFCRIPLFAPDCENKPHSSAWPAATHRPCATQPILTIAPVDDPLERQANFTAERVMGIRAGDFLAPLAPAQLNRKRTAPHQDGDQHDHLHRNPTGLGCVARAVAPPIVHQAIASPGQPLDAATRAFMEPLFDRDFGHVRVHTGQSAEASSRSIHALAYTVGNHIIFDRGQYLPHTPSGVRLLAHELAHVAQQGVSAATNRIFRFADNTHNLIDEVAVSAAVEEIAEAVAAANDFDTRPGDDERTVRNRDRALGEKMKSHMALEQIHEGNTQRDYSQSPRAVNFLLRCEPAKYGGYDANDHFDNFEWNKELEKWQTRNNPAPAGLTRTSEPQNPITHIQKEFLNFVNELPNINAFRHVGSAFHAIEDFFAHSNFIELTHGDYRFGKNLLTGSVPSGDQVSLLKIMESISNRDTAPLYGAAADKEIAAADPLSHPRIAKDYHSNVYQMESIVLAALVVKTITKDVFALRDIRPRDEQRKYVEDVIMPTVIRYLRPPDPKDKWWESLQAQGGALMEQSIRKAAAKTPVTINQCVWSPMRSIEAAKDVNLKLGGLTFQPTRANIFIQVGPGLAVEPAFNDQYGNVQTREVKGVKLGFSIGGSF